MVRMVNYLSETSTKVANVFGDTFVRVRNPRGQDGHIRGHATDAFRPAQGHDAPNPSLNDATGPYSKYLGSVVIH
jgi:hypothetical protein